MRIAIIGAGFAGLSASLALKGEVDVFEEHKEVGLPKHCTGLVSARVVEWLGRIAKDNVIGWIDKFIFLDEDLNSFIIRGPRRFAAVLDRVNLEREMLNSSSANFHLKSKVKSVTLDGKVDGKVYDYVILAEGWKGSLARSLGLVNKSKKLFGINVIFKPIERGVTYVILAKGWGDSFGWIVNADEESRVGVATERFTKVNEMLNYVVKIGKKLNLIAGERREIYGGIVQVGPPMLRPYKGKVYLLGDVAGLNKPLTGGGLYPTLKVVREWKGVPSRKAYHPLVERLYLETPLGKFVRRWGHFFIKKLKGKEFVVDEFDNHLKTALQLLTQLLGLT